MTCRGDLRGVTTAGAACVKTTPPLGLPMAGWNVRAAGHNRATHVHDDLFVRALVMRREDAAWAVITADVGLTDAVATGRIRQGVAQQTGLEPDAVLVCATHCHSAPVLAPVAAAQTREERNRVVVSRRGKAPPSPVGVIACRGSSALYVDDVDTEWRETFIARAVEAGRAAWGRLRPAEVAYVETTVAGVASSRRVRLADGTWGDPRRDPPASAPVVARTEIDPTVRVMLLRERGSQVPLAAAVNYGTHPWVFSGTGISAELAGAVCDKVAAAWTAADAEAPVVLFVTGPEGDSTLIWNIDLDTVWRPRPDEDSETGLRRREAGFHRELERLSRLVAEPVVAAIRGADTWSVPDTISARRAEVLAPLKEGYAPPPGIYTAAWQEDPPPGHCRTEVQLLEAGDIGLLGLPGEPFTAVGLAVRAATDRPRLLIAALANDCTQINYIATAEDYDFGGYELATTPAGPGAAEALVDAAAGLSRAGSGARKRPRPASRARRSGMP